jgi:pyruvate/2-oxoglutarate dehydrogenase complex dihydrolipoamide dehydrogenase (E3) component
VTRWEVDGQPQLSWEKLQSNKRKELERLSDLYMENLKKADVEYIEGRARIIDPNTVEVNGKQYRVRVPHLPEGTVSLEFMRTATLMALFNK